ncbi:NAD(P)-dependent oxidoreductase [Oceanobacter antarcticus]|jgi:3-hydroxyisobutyrate dehydrogenase-like beta-hydroxyacid dehydrogenase|uniref:NAD(P)-dependent oxidoreductase n=1 Tax=Oceanobacter antarcticus TaxID=3133425 RepID=A0ABW8NM81_9GAMM
MNIAFIGLGTMGFPMAGHLSNAGFNVTVYNRTESKADQWLQQYSGKKAMTPAAAAKGAEVILLCAGRDSDVETLMTGHDGILDGIRQSGQIGHIIIDHTTTSSVLAERMSVTAQQMGCHFVDAPVSGGQQGAINGQLSIMVGCDEQLLDKVITTTAPYTRAIARLGTAGFGQKTKMVNQICIAGLLQGLAEAIHFAQHNNLNIEKVIQVISQGAAGSWQMNNRYQTMLDNDYDHGFAIDWMRKDLGICLDQAKRSGVALPVTELVDQFYAELQLMGEGRSDTSVLLKRLQQQK